jgi:hypothetical protein
MNDGWIKIHRQITEWEWYQDPNVFRVFIHLLVTANHQKRAWKGVTVERGQTVTSVASIALQTAISSQSVRTALKKLEKTENLTIKSTNRFCVITLCNYDTYQTENLPANKPANKQLTNKQQTTNKQLTTNKNDKNERMKEVREEFMAENDFFADECGEQQDTEKQQSAYSEAFEFFWTHYPEKKAKGAAWKAWRKISNSERELCTPAIVAQTKAGNFRGADGKLYTPHPATWLNARRWEDEIKTRTEKNENDHSKGF